MKLGLIITNTANGLREAYVANVSDRVRANVFDVRTMMQQMPGIENGDTAFFLRFVSEGSFVGLIKDQSMSGRPYDNVTAWIFVPAEAKVDSAEIEEIIKGVRQQLDAPLGMDSNALDSLMQKDYPERSVAVPVRPSAADGELAWRMGVGITRMPYPEILDNLYQPGYERYRAVCLCSGTSKFTVNGPELPEAIVRLIEIPPLPDTHGFKPYIGRRPMTKPIGVFAGQTVEVMWCRNGFKTIDKSVKINSQGDARALLPAIDECKYEFTRAMVTVTSPKGQPVPNASVTVNGTLLTSQAPVGIALSKMQQVVFQASSPDYTTVTATINLTKTPNPSLQLKSATHRYTIDVEDEEGNTMEGQLTTPKLLSSTNPLMGYKFSKTSHLVFSKKPLLVSAAAGFVLALVVGAILWLCNIISLDFSSEPEATEPTQTEVTMPKDDANTPEETADPEKNSNPKQEDAPKKDVSKQAEPKADDGNAQKKNDEKQSSAEDLKEKLNAVKG